MGGEKITYKHWETGEEFTEELRNSHPAEHKTDLVCPFDDSPIIRWYNEMDKGYKCPNCGIDYNIEFKTQDEINKGAKEYFQRVEKKVDKLEKEKNELEKMLNHAAEKGII